MDIPCFGLTTFLNKLIVNMEPPSMMPFTVLGPALRKSHSGACLTLYELSFVNDATGLKDRQMQSA
eukprot:1146487-Pelagomonas_calceolata.AAC.9